MKQIIFTDKITSKLQRFKINFLIFTLKKMKGLTTNYLKRKNVLKCHQAVPNHFLR